MGAYLGATLTVLITVQFIFLIALKIRRNDLADVFWGPGFLVAAAGAWAGEAIAGHPNELGTKQIVLLGCLVIWAVRLFAHIGYRSLTKGKEDIRYSNFRREWGNTWVWRTYLQVFILQALLLLVIALPAIQTIHNSPEPVDGATVVGGLLWLFGFLFEAISDQQLKKFTSQAANKGKIMDRGLWSLSRHPNYFGEVVQWWGLFVMVSTSAGAWFTILSPLTITFLILKVSGVPMLEKLMEKRPGFAEYKNRTSLFFPWPAKTK